MAIPSIECIRSGRLTLRASERGGSIVDLHVEKGGQNIPVLKTTTKPFLDFSQGAWWMWPTARTGRIGTPGEFTWQGKGYYCGTGGFKENWGIHGSLCRVDLRLEETRNGLKYYFDSEAHPEIFPALWPFAFDAEIEYRLENLCLECTIKMRNRSDVIAPLGCGLHLFYPHSPVPGSYAELKMKAQSYYPKRLLPGPEQCFLALPEGKSQNIPLEDDYSKWRKVNLGHDDGYYGVTYPVQIRWPGAKLGVRIESSEAKHFTLFSPEVHDSFRPEGESGFFAGEPLTAMANALILEEDGVDSGVSKVIPGGVFSTKVSVIVEDI